MRSHCATTFTLARKNRPRKKPATSGAPNITGSRDSAPISAPTAAPARSEITKSSVETGVEGLMNRTIQECQRPYRG